MKNIGDIIIENRDIIRYRMEKKGGETREEFDKRIVVEDFNRAVMGELLLSEEVVDRLLKESLRGYDGRSLIYIPEGINIDISRKKVS